MVKDAEAHAEEDEATRETVELRNNADNSAYAAEKMLTDNAEVVPEELKTEVEEKVAALRETLEAEDNGAIQTALQELQTSLNKVGEVVYQQSAASGADGADGATPSEEGGEEGDAGETVEGEYREVSEDKPEPEPEAEPGPEPKP